MMAGEHFPRKNVSLSTRGEIKKLRFLRKMTHIQEEIISRAGMKQIRIFLKRAH